MRWLGWDGWDGIGVNEKNGDIFKENGKRMVGIEKINFIFV
jgi:hypothetical protein